MQELLALPRPESGIPVLAPPWPQEKGEDCGPGGSQRGRRLLAEVLVTPSFLEGLS